ncbi:MAG: hypothetical protein IIU58_05715, partial [Clostridia bacterium]|nr:hypothetical protein [Clostridia bacterium]
MMKLFHRIIRVFLTVWCAMLFFSVFCMTTLAVEEKTCFYVSASSGSDKNSGLSAEQPVRSLNCAMLAAVMSKTEKAVIVITDEYFLSQAQTELVHKMPFVFTTNDGKTDYGAKGAKLKFGKGLRFFLNGETTFENIAIEYSGTLNFVAQYNPITFGEGVTHTRPEGESGVYIVGGWQDPGKGKATDLDSHITVNSGNIAYVVGGSRNGTDLTFTGTHSITVNGGEIKTMYAGSLNKHKSQNIDLTVNGGRIQTLYVNGDDARVVNGTANIKLFGGSLSYAYIHNVIQDVTVSLFGTKVEEMKVDYTKSAYLSLQKQANRPKTLIYSGHAYTAEEISSFTGFTVLENQTVVYAKQGATGDGYSVNSPASFAEAMQIAAKIGGQVKIIGNMQLDTYTEPVHSEKITISGDTADAELWIHGEYTLSGDTCFEELTLAGKGTVNAENGILETKDSIRLSSGSDLLLLGSADLGGGTFSELRAAKNVRICGATLEKITGCDTETHVEVTSGSIGTLCTTDSSIQVFTLTMVGGNVDKVIFRNVTDRLVYRVFGGKVSEYAVEGENTQGKLSAEDTTFSTKMLGAAESLFTKSDEAVFFLRDGANGSGKSVYDASSSMKTAYDFLAETGGTIVVCGPYTMTSAANFRHEKPIVITSRYNGVDYTKREGAELIFGINFYCGGDTEFRDITLTANG